MSYSQDEIIELTAAKVQEVVCPKIEHFMDGVSGEVHKMHLEMKSNREFDATVISQLNDVRAKVASFSDTEDKVNELHTLFCRNGYMQKFNKLSDDWNNYLARDRVVTCPVVDDVKLNSQLIRENTKMIWEERERQEAHANGKARTRREDKFKSATIIISVSVALASWLTLVTKLVGWW